MEMKAAEMIQIKPAYDLNKPEIVYILYKES